MKRQALISILLLSLQGCNYINKELGLPNDNIYEESIEALIDYETGVNVDLSY